jgi:hypothetical protein
MYFKNLFFQDQRLDFTSQKDKEKSDTGSDAEPNVDDINGFKTMPINHPSIKYDDFIQNTSEEMTQKFFDKVFSKAVFNFRYLIVLLGMIIFFKNVYNMS